MNDNQTTTPYNPHTLDALWNLQKIILETPDFEGIVVRVVNSILVELGYLQLGYRILVLTLVDKNTQTLKRIALSQTPEAQRAMGASPVPFEKIEIPLHAEDNLLIRALKDNKVYITHFWPDIFRPVLSDEAALRNQAAAGIKTSMLFPLTARGEVIGVMIFSLVKGEEEVSQEEKDLIERFTDIVGLAVQNAQLYSSQKDTSEELRLANEHLLESSKAKDEFLLLATHELRTPLSEIKAYAWKLLNPKQGQTGLTDIQKHDVEVVSLATDRLIRLVNNLLSYSRLKAGKYVLSSAPVHLEQIVQEVITEQLALVQLHKIQLNVITPQQPLPVVSADADKIKEVLINLIGNAIKFTPEGGSITISFQDQEDKILTQVQDTGQGIRQEDLPKLFEKFSEFNHSSTQAQGVMGTGLGLYISKMIISMHGGEIRATSAGEGKGSIFSFTLFKA